MEPITMIDGRSKVSIALCTYNGAQHLAVQLDSLIAQTYSPIELIIVDDCSTDTTYALLQRYKEAHPDTIQLYRNSNNMGFVKNFEKAIGLCTGEFIALCDQDDYWEPHKLTTLMTAIDKHVLIYHNSALWEERSEKAYFFDRFNYVSGHDIRPFVLYNCISGHAMLFRKELIADALPIPYGIFHDWWIVMAALNKGTIGYTKEALVHYRLHQHNETDFHGHKTSLSASQNFDNHWNYLSNFSSAPFMSKKNQAWINQLKSLYVQRRTQSFALALFWFYLCNWPIFTVLKKTFFSKLNLARKEARGINQ